MKNKGGAPTKGSHLTNEQERQEFLNRTLKSKVLKIKLTYNEHQLLENMVIEENKIRKITKTDFVLSKVFGHFERDHNKAINMELLKELNKIGLNINQAVKKVNSYQYIDSQNALNIQNHLSFINEKMTLLLNKIENI